jgi:hypothetical protein
MVGMVVLVAVGQIMLLLVLPEVQEIHHRCPRLKEITAGLALIL